MCDRDVSQLAAELYTDLAPKRIELIDMSLLRVVYINHIAGSLIQEGLKHTRNPDACWLHVLDGIYQTENNLWTLTSVSEMHLQASFSVYELSIDILLIAAHTKESGAFSALAPTWQNSLPDDICALQDPLLFYGAWKATIFH